MALAGEKEASARVREMFGGIAPRYDFLNHVLSLSLDRLWRRRVVKRFRDVLDRPDARVLDLCCGTGDLTLALSRRSRATIYGSDFAHPMLTRAGQKSPPIENRKGSRTTLAGYIEADALSLPFPRCIFRFGHNCLRISQPGELRPRPSGNVSHPASRAGELVFWNSRAKERAFWRAIPLLLSAEFSPRLAA